MLAIGLGSISIVELLVVLLVGGAQLAFLFLFVYAAVRVAQRNSPADLIDRFTAWFDRALERTARVTRRLRNSA